MSIDMALRDLLLRNTVLSGNTGLNEAARAFQNGEEHRALTLLGRLVETAAPGSAEWAQLERLRGLVLIHILREVEGTFALERADAVLDQVAVSDQVGGERPTLDWLLDWLAEAPPEQTAAEVADGDAATPSPEHRP